MDASLVKIAQACLDAAESNTMTFPEIVGTLVRGGFESYAIDYRQSTATYFLPNGESIVLPTRHVRRSVAATLDAGALQAAVKEAQQLTSGYTYTGFCQKVMAAGCAGYIVSFSGRRAVYFGRTAETHVEHFPQNLHIA